MTNQIPADLSVPELIERAASLYPDRLALVERDRALTYRELVGHAVPLARRLRERGVGPDERVAVCCAPGITMVVAQLAVVMAGGAYVSLDPESPPRRLAFMIEDAGAMLTLADERVAGLGGEVWQMGGVLAHCKEPAETRRPVDWAAPREDHLVYVIYTSGSTGEPKGVLLEHRCLLNYIRWDIEAFGLGPDERVSQVIAPSFDMSVWEIWPTLASGASLHFADRADYGRPGALWRWLAEEAITQCVLPTPLAERLLAEPRPAPLALRRMMIGGDRLRVYPDPDAPFAVYTCYGPTETTMSAMWALVPGDPADRTRPPHIGRGIDNARILVLDEAMRPVAVGEVGEIYIGGPGVARGYHRREELTRERFLPDPFVTGGELTGGRGTATARLYRSGDLARVRADGNLDFVGRIDHQIKLRGHRIELGEIEATLASHPRLHTAVALLRSSPAGDRLVVYTAPAPGQEPPGEAELLAHARERLPAYMVPSRVVVLPEMPLTPNGKIDRERLPAGEATGPGEGLDEGSVTGRMASLWRRALGVEQVGLHDEFLALGGHSIVALSLLDEVERAFGVKLGLQHLLEASTVEAFCRQVQAAQGGGAVVEARGLTPGEPANGDPHAPFALTDVQHAYWLGRQAIFELGEVTTHSFFEVEGPLDVARLQAAWRRVVDHHAMLRAVISEDGQQRVLPQVPPYTIRTHDLSGAPAAEVEAHLSALRAALSHQVLPADRWPLFDLQATLLPGGLVRLHLGFDALVLDAQSLLLVLDDWHRLSVDPGRQLLPVKTSFRDYALARERLKQTAAHAVAAAYWRERVSALPPGPELPLAVDPRELGRPTFRRRRFDLTPSAWSDLRRRAQGRGVTETAALLTAYAEVLAGWSKSAHFCLNLTLFQRLPLGADVDRIAGDFTSLTLLEVDQRSLGRFVERARTLQQRLWRDLDHRLYSAVEVLRDRASRHGRMSVPVVFTSELGFDALGRDAAVLDRFGREVDALTQTPQVWLDVLVIDRAGALVVLWDAVEALFPAGVLDAMVGAFQRGIEALASADEAWDSPGWSPSPPPGLAALEPPAAAAPCGLLQDGFLTWAARTPGRLALVSSRRSLRYGEVLALAERVRDALTGHDGGALSGAPSEGALVGVVLPKGWEQAVAVIGVLLAGRAYVPIDPALPDDRRLGLLDRAEVRVVLTSPALARGRRWPSGVRLIEVDDHALSLVPVAAAGGAVARDPDAVAYVLFTSGSTGVPKGVVIEHRGAVNTIEDVNERGEVGPDDRVLALSSLGFDLSVYDLFGLLGRGGAVVFPDEDRLQDPEHWLDCIRRHRVTLWNSVPALAGLLADAADGDRQASLEPLRLAMLSGDWIPVTLPGRLRRLRPGMAIFAMGGATEASIWSVLHEVREVDPTWRSIPYGRAMRDQRALVLDGQLRPRPPWVVGEIYLGGVGLARGYLGDPDRTAAAFVVEPVTGERLYRTGDLGRYRPDGEIEFLGREDHQVKINGYRVELGEVETVLGRHPAVETCAVAARGAAGARRLVGGWVSSQDVAPSELRAYLAQHLPAYMIPDPLRRLEALPVTSNGKVDRAALAQLCDESPAQGAGTWAADEAERTVAALWAEVLDQPAAQIDVERNFFDAGGDSVAAIRLRMRLESTLGRPVPLAVIFEHATVRSFARFLHDQDRTPPDRGADERANRRRQAAGRARRRTT